ncbi:MAG: precorrin-8X methylmutase, partial [Actinomycetes bacterium]
MSTRTIPDIEAQSYAILRARLDTSGLPPWTRAVVERVVHASADLAYATDLVALEPQLASAAAALAEGA